MANHKRESRNPAPLTAADVAEWAPAVRWVVGRFNRVLRPDEYDDAEQEAWIEIMASWHRFDPALEGGRRDWIFRNARLGIIHWLRSGKRSSDPVAVGPKGRRKVGGGPVRGSLPDELPGRAVDDPFEVEDLLATATREANRELSELEREMVTLVFAHGFSFADLAQIRGRSKSAVTKAMRRLFPFLEQPGMKGASVKATPAAIAKARALRAQGVTLKDAARQVGLATVTLFRAIKRTETTAHGAAA